MLSRLAHRVNKAEAANLVAGLANGYIGYGVTQLSPLIVTSLMLSRGFDATQAGGIMTAEILASGLSQFLTAVLVKRVSPRILGLIGATIFIAANFVACVRLDLYALGVLRIISGFGSGINASLVASAAARSERPERVYSVTIFCVTVLSFLLLLLLPLGTSHFGIAAVYFGLASSAVLTLPGMWLLKRPLLAATTGFTAKSGFAFAPIVVVLLAVFLYNMGNTAYWAFAGTLAQAAGLDEQKTGTALSIATLSGLLGSMLVWVTHKRLGPTKALWIGLLADAACVVIMSVTRVTPVFYVSAAGQAIAANFHTPYQLSTASTLDADGRWAMVAMGISCLTGVAPVLAGAWIDHSGLKIIGISSLALSVAAAMLFTTAIYLTRAGGGEIAVQNSPVS